MKIKTPPTQSNPIHIRQTRLEIGGRGRTPLTIIVDIDDVRAEEVLGVELGD